MEKYQHIIEIIDSLDEKETDKLISMSRNLKDAVVKRAIHAANEGKKKCVNIFPDSINEIEEDYFESKIWISRINGKKNVLYSLISKHDNSTRLKELGFIPMIKMYSRNGEIIEVLDVYQSILVENGFSIKKPEIKKNADISEYNHW